MDAKRAGAIDYLLQLQQPKRINARGRDEAEPQKFTDTSFEFVSVSSLSLELLGIVFVLES